MSDRNTLRILSLDGGGERGYLSLKFFQKFVQQWGITPSDIWKNFDVIAGTSIGGITGLGYAYGLSPDELEPFFTEEGPWLFTIRTPLDVAEGSHNASYPSNRPNRSEKVLILGNNDQFYTSAYSDSNYGSVRFYEQLTATFGSATLQNLKTNILIPSYRYNTNTPVLFSNVNYADFIGQNELITNVAKATSAAPLYLPPVDFGGNTYIDGGVYQNNPAQLALNLAKMIKPTANRYCVLSLGTGLGKIGFDNTQPSFQTVPQLSDYPFEYAVTTLVSLFGIAMTGAQEAVSKGLYLQSEYTLDNLYYYRFQPQLDLNINTELDNTDPAFLAYLDTVATEWFNNDIDNISTFIGHLTA